MDCRSTRKPNETRAFVSKIAPGEHIAQFYADDSVLLEALTAFAAGGLTAGDSIIVIATREHLRALRERLVSARVDLANAIIQDRYITLNAETALSAFMLQGWPDEALFRCLISHLLERAAANSRRVRAFGEMVALLWAQGCTAATVRLEQLWNQFCEESRLSLFCAYPSAGFDQDASRSLAEICAVHSRVIGAPSRETANSSALPAA